MSSGTGDSECRWNARSFGPSTIAVTSKCRFSGGAVPLTGNSALASPPPTREALGQPAGPLSSSVSAPHLVRPLALSLNVFGDVIVSLPSVLFGSLFLIVSSIAEFFGFVFVPAFLGVIFTFIVAAGVWARAAV